MRSRLLAVAAVALLVSGCKFDVGQYITHPTVDDRVAECRSGTLTAPGPVAVDPDSFRFAVFGDIHTEPGKPTLLDSLARDIGPLGIDFFCVAGDITNHGNAEEYALARTYLDRVGVPWYVTIGNHDLYQSAGWQSFKQTFGPSCYSVVVGGHVKLIFMDSADGTLGERQFAWLDSALADTTVARVVITHYPVFDGTLPIMWRLASTAERYRLEHLLAKHRAYAYCSGHLHAWRYSLINGVRHFICGSMCPGALDYGTTKGYLLLTFAHDSLSWAHVEYPAAQ